MVYEDRASTDPVPTVCVNEGAAIVPGTLTLVQYPLSVEELQIESAGAVDFNNCSLLDISHASLADVGSNTHVQIDAHLGNASLHRTINDSGTSATELWSASKINSELGSKAATGHTHTASDVTSGTLALARGGTGESTAMAAFDALAPSTTKGDLVVHNGSDNTRLGVGSNGHVLTADSTEASGVKWAPAGGGVYGTEYHYAASESESTTTSSSWVNKTTLTTSSLPAGTYRLGYSWEISNARNGVLSRLQVVFDGTEVALPSMEADNDYLQFGGFVHQACSGVVTCTINHRRSGGTSKLRRARLELWRVE